ncbi:MAG: sulfotransferase family protein [Proteobacteria bacterium]|nr:MAG: sulfotransferase family protein [Pseudomonadota bacterium]
MTRLAASEEGLLDAARQATGLDDFGDGAWRTHFRTLLRCYDAESKLTEAGLGMVQGEIGGALRARLACEAAWKREPAVLRHAIRRPLFILGLPRSGTTALHWLLAQDPANQVLEYWIAGAPRPRPPRATWEAEPAYQGAIEVLKWIYETDPGLKAIHWMEADGPEECRHLFVQSFLDHTFDSNATIPGYTKYFEAQDMRPAYARHRDVLKLVGATSPERRWVLKYPAHMRELDVLLETYPDACIVQTHRDPARVLPSICSLVTGWRSLYEGSADAHAIGAWQLEMYASMLEKAMEVRARSHAAQFFDLDFAELVADPIAALGRMYEHFGFDFSAEAERRMRAWHATNPQHKHGGHRYALAQFGLAEGAIRERFARYAERFGVRPEAAAE